MCDRIRVILLASVFAGGVAAASSLNAEDSRGSSGSMMGRGGMMGSGMMNMMGSMMKMMEHCGEMMQGMDGGGGARPNEQWRKPSVDTN